MCIDPPLPRLMPAARPVSSAMTILGVDPGGEQVAVVAVAGDDAVGPGQRRLDAGDDRLLADVEVAEAADQPHAVHLPGTLLEAADEQHLAIEGEQLVVGRVVPLRIVWSFADGRDRFDGRGGFGHATRAPTDRRGCYTPIPSAIKRRLRLFGVGQRDNNLIGSHDAEIAPDQFVGKVAVDMARIEQARPAWSGSPSPPRRAPPRPQAPRAAPCTAARRTTRSTRPPRESRSRRRPRYTPPAAAQRGRGRAGWRDRSSALDTPFRRTPSSDYRRIVRPA